ncbi:MAG: hypothetical protein AAF290_16540 [Pseudomonadota bacterium]
MRNGCLQAILAIIVAILVALALWWWFILRDTPDLPQAETDDAGDYAFVRQVVPMVTGRKIRGYAETQVLADLIRETDRSTLLQLMMKGSPTYRDEYISHWSDLMVDWMRVHRSTPKAQNACFDDPRLSSPDERIARYIRDNDAFRGAGHPGASLGGSATDYNMSDVLNSALKLDNVAPAWQAYLFAMINKPIGGNEVTEQNRRTDLGATFTHVYTNRQMTCLGCHTSTTSASGPETYWNRHFPVFGNFEKAVFGFDTGRDSREVEALLRVDGVRNGTVRPWGLDSCGVFRAPAAVPNDPLTIPETGAPLEAFFIEPLGRQASVWDLESRLRDGILTLATDGFERGPDADVTEACNFCDNSCEADGSPSTNPIQIALEAEVQTIVNERCVSCHTDRHDSWAGNAWRDAWIDNNLIVPGNAAASQVVQRVSPGSMSRMPPAYAMGTAPDGTPLNSALTSAQIDSISEWIATLTDGIGDCSMCAGLDCTENQVDGNAAFAYLVASNIVSNTWAEVFGDELMIANYFPRSAGQGSALWNLTENEFLPNNWSLQRILSRMMTSSLFNRRAPEFSLRTYAYELPLAFDPWTEADPRMPPRAMPGWTSDSGDGPESDPAFTLDDNTNRSLTYNGVGETIHRYRPRSLLYSVHSAMDWPAPQRFSSAGYPSDSLRKAIGQFWRDAEPGFNDVDFQGLLNWESTHGRCENPTASDDWIDKIMTEIPGFNAANPSSPVRYRDLAVTMKDWLLGYGTIDDDPSAIPNGASASERALVEALLGGWDGPVDAASAALEQGLRDYCGVLLQSPQYLLAGISPIGPGAEPRLRVCSDNAGDCSYQAICERFQPGLLGRAQLICNTDSLQVVYPVVPPPIDQICPGGRCGFIDVAVDIDCLLDPASCPLPPKCDLGCATIDCCGGPLPPLDRPGYLLSDLAGATVGKTSGVLVRPQQTNEFSPLEPGQKLRAGDVLALMKGSTIEIQSGEKAKMRVDDIPSKGESGTWYLVVAEPVIDNRRPLEFQIRHSLPASFQNGALENPWSRYGEVGPPQMGGQIQEMEAERRNFRGDSNAPALPLEPPPKQVPSERPTYKD